MRKRQKWRIRPLWVLVLVLVVAAMGYVGTRFRKEALAMAAYHARMTATAMVNDSVAAQLSRQEQGNLVVVTRNYAGEVVSVETDVRQISLLKTGVTRLILQRLKELSTDRFSIPLGNLTGNGFLSARGPELSFRFVPVGTVEIQTISRLDGCGINQSLHQIVLSVEMELSAMTSFQSVRVRVPTQVILAETVIVGAVPEQYTHVITSDRELVQELNDYGTSTP